ncbi:MAG: hypothetical protein QOD49_2053 [Actinomycetota bacterium]|jgi:hypothetical protein|nr:hypothetical protein [Actinomycetota bacterium]
MAVPGRFETTRKIIFALCRTSQIVIARSKDWTGDLRTDLVCTTPGCTNVLEDQRTKNRATKRGIVRAFADGFAHKPMTTFGSMNTDVLERTVPGYHRPNFCDLIAANSLGG